VTAYLELMKSEIRTWRDARLQVCEILGKSDEDISKLDGWIDTDFAIDDIPNFEGEAIRQQARNFRRAFNTYALVNELEKREPIAAAIDALDWYKGGSPHDKATLWLLISRLYRKLELELPEDTLAMFDTWLRESEIQKEAIRVSLQVRLNAFRIACHAKGTPASQSGTPASGSPDKQQEDWAEFKKWGLKHFRDGATIQSRVICIADGCQRYADFVASQFATSNSIQQSRGFNAFKRDVNEKAETTNFTFKLERDGNDLVLLPRENSRKSESK
jgi:hypothetical protein